MIHYRHLLCEDREAGAERLHLGRAVAAGVQAVRQCLRHRGDGGLQLGRAGEWGLLGGVLLQPGRVQCCSQSEVRGPGHGPDRLCFYEH